jgi:hypothetical protein
MKEWQRTLILLALLGFALGVILWLRQSYEVNFINTL